MESIPLFCDKIVKYLTILVKIGRMKIHYRAYTIPYGAGFSYGKQHVFIVIQKMKMRAI